MNGYKCKMCGGTVEFAPGASVGECDSCGTQQPIPKLSSDNVNNLFNRANNLLLKCEFDKAEQLYEKIIEEDDSQGEAHWGIVLCKYGIEYVEDPDSHRRVPTCHRTLFEAVASDPDYLAAIDYSDTLQQTMYEKEAREIDRLQREILSIVRNEQPFDIFLCYKETDNNGQRTVDSAITNDIYYQLTQEGFKVFYAPITLEDKLGQEYEPYIFAALNSAKVMLVIGTKPEYFNAVWVRNEWSRFIKIMKQDRSKLLIPCYKDMDAYELPDEFAHLQAQDMGKIGFINDVVRGIKKVIIKEEPQTAAPAVNTVPSNNVGQTSGQYNATDTQNNVNFKNDVVVPLKNEFGKTVKNIGTSINNSINTAISNKQTTPREVSVTNTAYYPTVERPVQKYNTKLGGKSRLLALVLCIVAGTFGIHNFYLGDIKKGIIRLCFSWCGIGTLLAIIDFLKLLTDTYTVKKMK